MTFWGGSLCRLLSLSVVCGFLASSAVRADRENTAIKPSVKDEARHKGFVELARKGHIDVLFLGDSITDGWRGSGMDVWKERFEPMRAANFGIGGDRTQHVLWRLENGELEPIQPKVAVLMIGTNNMGDNTVEEIAAGVTAIVKEIHHQKPHTKVLLLGIFPRGAKATDPIRSKIREVNQIIAKLDDGGKHVRYLDIAKVFLDQDGNLPKEIMPDALHLSKEGYKIEADAIQPAIEELLKR